VRIDISNFSRGSQAKVNSFSGLVETSAGKRQHGGNAAKGSSGLAAGLGLAFGLGLAGDGGGSLAPVGEAPLPPAICPGGGAAKGDGGAANGGGGSANGGGPNEPNGGGPIGGPPAGTAPGARAFAVSRSLAANAGAASVTGKSLAACSVLGGVDGVRFAGAGRIR